MPYVCIQFEVTLDRARVGRLNRCAGGPFGYVKPGSSVFLLGPALVSYRATHFELSASPGDAGPVAAPMDPALSYPSPGQRNQP